ncbi:MAG: hypothetical protein FWD91_08430 [Treponema sp.]|nr:hypothetical protein [Treponema sp.]
MVNSVFQGEIDPEIAALLGTETAPNAGGDNHDFSHIFSESETGSGEDGGEASGEPEQLDLGAESFPVITKRIEETPHKAFQDPAYYKAALSGEGDIAQRVHGILQKFLNAKDPKDKSVFRQQFIPAYWEFLSGVGRKAPGKLPNPKKFLLRFGILHPDFIDATSITFLGKIIVENTLNQPVYYLDEWLKAIGTGIIRNSSTDEAQVGKSNVSIKLQQLLEKAKGKLDGTRTLLKAKNEERLQMEKLLVGYVRSVTEHFPLTALPDVSSPYSDGQRRSFAEMNEAMKNLLRTDNALATLVREFTQAEEDVQTLLSKVEEDGGAVEVDTQAVTTEFETVKQMAKMTIGRQGNHFPILTKDYFHCQPNDIGFRENIISLLTWIESVDPEAFCRSYKNRLNRIAPYVVLIPTYGDSGFCWEPFDRFNRATSRGRIAVPMYPRSLQIALLTAVADLRWQVAKEKASYYWMEEGITGNYYQWFQKMKLKGDLKESFIQDYILWMTKESEGTQKLDKDLRGIFWRHIPFGQPIKEKLKTRNFAYQELYQRDINRSMSDGY